MRRSGYCGAASVVALSITVGLVVLPAPRIGAQRDASAAATLTPASFANPPKADRPLVRWNVPAGAEIPELQIELRQMAADGIGGAEIGQGAFPDRDQLVAILTTANELGLAISLSHGPVSGPPDFALDDPNARKTLIFGSTTAPGQPPGGQAAGRGAAVVARVSTLVAAVAYRCSTPQCAASGTVGLDSTSAIDLTATVVDRNAAGVNGGTTAGTLTWTAPATPADAEWKLLTFWTQGAIGQPDLLSTEGTRVLTSYMDADTPRAQLQDPAPARQPRTGRSPHHRPGSADEVRPHSSRGACDKYVGGRSRVWRRWIIVRAIRERGGDNRSVERRLACVG